jgi:hypothetical protein
MKTLEKLNDELAAVEKTAALNPEELPPQTRGAWTAAINDARDRVKSLRAEYRTVLLRNSVAIFLSGDQAKVAEFAKLAEEEGAIVVDASALYTAWRRKSSAPSPISVRGASTRPTSCTWRSRR